MMKSPMLTLTDNRDTSAGLANLAPLLAEAQTFADNARSARTRKVYGDHWAVFIDWCAERKLSSMPASAETVVAYLVYRSKTLKVSTLAQVLVTISVAHEMSGHKSPRLEPRVREVWKGLKNSLGTAPRRVAPAVLEDIRAMVGSLPDKTLLAARNRALLVVGFAGAFRRSELVALQVSDVAFTGDGLVVTIRRSKTDQEGAGVTVGLPYGSDRSTCPVRTLQAWLELSGIVYGPLFRSVNRHGRAGPALTGRSVARIVKSAAEAAGLDASRYSGHSLRAGLATSAAKAKKSDRAIMRHGRWSSREMVDRYVRDATILDDDNPAAGIGL